MRLLRFSKKRPYSVCETWTLKDSRRLRLVFSVGPGPSACRNDQDGGLRVVCALMASREVALDTLASAGSRQRALGHAGGPSAALCWLHAEPKSSAFFWLQTFLFLPGLSLVHGEP